MIDRIEHPDHTGASANPDAPWNQPDPNDACDYCGLDLNDDGTCRVCDTTPPKDAPR